MTPPTHEEISRHAYRLWEDRGCPDDCDTEIWLEAEWSLTDDPSAASARAESVAESEAEYNVSPAVMEQNSIKADVRKQAARAPKSPRHTGPKTTPAVTGKPLWPHPKSS